LSKIRLSFTTKFSRFGGAGENGVLCPGALSGIAGAVEVLGVHYRLIQGFSQGFGFNAVAVALLAALNPVAVLPAGLFFGFLEAGALAMQRGSRSAILARLRDSGSDDGLRLVRSSDQFKTTTRLICDGLQRSGGPVPHQLRQLCVLSLEVAGKKIEVSAPSRI
jgi:hypothetical protein